MEQLWFSGKDSDGQGDGAFVAKGAGQLCSYQYHLEMLKKNPVVQGSTLSGGILVWGLCLYVCMYECVYIFCLSVFGLRLKYKTTTIVVL